MVSTDLLLPNLIGIARATTVNSLTSASNVGAAYTETLYTVPVGRGAAITQAFAQIRGGTVPTTVLLNIRTSAGVTRSRPVRKDVPIIDVSYHALGTVWMAETDFLQFQIAGGDGTTDIEASLSGIEFDWTDKLSFAVDISEPVGVTD